MRRTLELVYVLGRAGGSDVVDIGVVILLGDGVEAARGGPAEAMQAEDAEVVCGRQLVGAGEGAADGAGYGRGHGHATAPSSSERSRLT
jgi:hypothetical protein